MRILITGASGFIGSHLLDTLARDGHEAIRFKRGGGPSEDPLVFAGPAMPSSIETDGPWPEGIETLIHLAAKVPAGRNGPRGNDETFESNVEWTRALTARARAEGVKRIVFLSSAGVHGSGRETPYREDDTLEPLDAYAKSKKAAEEAFWKALGDDRSIGVVLRPPRVFGKGGRGLVEVLVKLAKRRAPLPLKGIGSPRSLIAVDHLAAVISLCLTHDGARGETFLVADDGPMRPEDIVSAVRRGLNRPAGLLPVPTRLLHMAANAAGLGATWETRTRPCILDTTRLKAKLGWESPITSGEKMRLMTAAGEL